MDLVILIAAAVAVVAVAGGLAVTVGQRHQRERREVETMFSTDSDDRLWWDDLR